LVEFEDLETVTASIASKLRNGGILTVESLTSTPRSRLKEILKGVSEKKISEIQEEAWKKRGLWFTPAIQLYEKRKEELIFSTGCKALDQLLKGGVRTCHITEFAGEYRSGKSECLLTLTAETLAKNPEYSAIFLDSEESFSGGARLYEIAEQRGYDPQDILKRVIYMPVYNTNHFKAALVAIRSLIKERNVKLVLIDSLTAHYRSEYTGRETLWQRQQLLNLDIHTLLTIARDWNVAVAVTNQVTDNPQILYTSDPVQQKIPVGGNIVAHGMETRIHLRPAGSIRNRRIAYLHDSSWLAQGECVFQITAKGIEDVPEEENRDV